MLLFVLPAGGYVLWAEAVLAKDVENLRSDLDDGEDCFGKRVL